MNTLNHHKVISLLGLGENETKILKEASDFTDDFCKDADAKELKLDFIDREKLKYRNLNLNEENYFYYHFYYDIECEENQCNEGKITLRRCKRNENKIEATIGKCTLGQNEKKYKKSHIFAGESYDGIKEFFTLINGRDKYLKSGFTESSNQSDCVAFLHAMAAKEEISEEEKLLFPDQMEDEALKRQRELIKKDLLYVLDKIQDGIGVAGFLPGIGTVPDLINAAIYTLRGDFTSASTSLVSCIPGVGDAFGVVSKAATKKLPTSLLKHITPEFFGNIIQSATFDSVEQLFDAAREVINNDQTTEVINTNTSYSSSARSVFENHLRRCFAEYLFLKDDVEGEEALFILGIALHGIMDSFTPSHTAFQKYGHQNMTLHTQGDVMPIRPQGAKGNNVPIDRFDPGEADAETWATGGKAIIMSLIKGHSGNLYLNSFEYKMLWIYFLISDISPVNNEVSPSTCRELNLNEIYLLWKTFEGNSREKINHVLRDGWNYGNRAWIYSDNAIKAVSEIYTYLYNEKQKIQDYSTYKEIIKKEGIIDKALNIWRTIYDGMYKDEEFKKRQNLLRLIFKENADIKENLSIRYSDAVNAAKSKLSSTINDFLIWTGESTDFLKEKGQELIDSYSKNSVENVKQFLHDGGNKA